MPVILNIIDVLSCKTMLYTNLLPDFMLKLSLEQGGFSLIQSFWWA